MAKQPTLFDQVLALPDTKLHMKTAKEARSIQARVRRAEKLVFDTEASRRVGTVLRDVPELLVEQIQFARAPFDHCWIEYNALAMWQVLAPPGKDVRWGPSDRDYDTQVGLLVEHNRVTVVSRSASGDIGVVGWVYHLNTEWPLSDQLDFCNKTGLSRTGIDQWLWGSVWNKFRDAGRTDYMHALRDTNKAEFWYDFPPKRERAVAAMRGSTGDFKNVVALLLMLNQPSATHYIHVAGTRGWVGNKPRPFMAHHTVEVSLDAVSQIVKLSQGDGTGELRRRHRVRGHYCHDETAREYMRIAGCVHEWEACDYDWTPLGAHSAHVLDPEHWKCVVCGGKRWWRAQHERGDASKGFVDHPDYRVTAKKPTTVVETSSSVSEGKEENNE